MDPPIRARNKQLHPHMVRHVVNVSEIIAIFIFFNLRFFFTVLFLPRIKPHRSGNQRKTVRELATAPVSGTYFLFPAKMFF